ncbi:MerR family transcriptional regulator [Streptomyces albipurpureus]|uniref:TipAS antibiotic-recognition domain-containing protein n=1 Tax=Streptomyces albipurpureus TaxID=2897419 RepID=A0ABT0UUN9_9ACTN|nr:TipAS antibiotic-recognition domain-containing protein [Streptomyces sp. CWNU-1]MCM2390911.1 TipAS antibiotic-recognition domain-containing protein [Streptomyces sp. CWNU-1]
MEWSIQEIARRAGTTSRTLRHYGDLGLLEPSRVGTNGYRYYGPQALVRLQRILLLRELGLGLSAIAEVLEGQRDTTAALRTHLGLLERERERIERQIASVRTTLHKTERGEQLMPEEVLDGFDHTRYQQEVTERWGRDAYRRSDQWWRSLSEVRRREFLAEQTGIAKDFAQALKEGLAADSDVTQSIVRRQYEWLSTFDAPSKCHFIGLGEMYAADERFTATYDQHGAGTAVFIRDAMRVYGERHLADD